MKPFFKPKLYLSARISPDAHSRNNRVANYLKEYFDVFLPHEHQACDGDHRKIGPEVYLLDITAMKNSDLAVLIPPYGRDCSFEVGWYRGNNKPVFVYTDSELDWTRDLMIKGGIVAVLTDNEKTYKSLMKDPVLKFKTLFISESEYLGPRILKIYDDMKNGEILMGKV